jgi:hypothetical protein
LRNFSRSGGALDVKRELERSCPQELERSRGKRLRHLLGVVNDDGAATHRGAAGGSVNEA